MRTIIILLLLLPLRGLSEEVRLAVGDSQATMVQDLRRLGAVDMTPNMDVAPARGLIPASGLYWAIPDFKMVVEIDTDGTNEKVKSICFWSEDDFNVSKTHREKSRGHLRSIIFDTKDKTMTKIGAFAPFASHSFSVGLFLKKSIGPLPDPLSQPLPEYPTDMLVLGQTAIVQIRVTIGKEGTVHDVVVLKKSALFQAFEDSVVATARKWTFFPARYDGAEVDSSIVYEVLFKMRDDEDFQPPNKRTPLSDENDPVPPPHPK